MADDKKSAKTDPAQRMLTPRSAFIPRRKVRSRFARGVGQRTGRMQYRQIFDDAIGKLKAEQRYRVFADIERDSSALSPRHLAQARWRGAGSHHLVLQRLSRHGPPPASDRGDDDPPPHGTAPAPAAPAIFPAPTIRSSKLEAEFADLHGKEAALVFTSGWISNLAAISTIADLLPDCLILSDALNHNSMIEGVRRSKARAADLPPQRSSPISKNFCARRAARPRQADRVREPLFDGRRHRPDRGRLPIWPTLQRHDLYRRGPCGRRCMARAAAASPSAKAACTAST